MTTINDLHDMWFKKLKEINDQVRSSGLDILVTDLPVKGNWSDFATRDQLENTPAFPVKGVVL